MEKPIIDGLYLVEKRTAQSGFKMSDWTYVVLSDFPPVERTRIGTFRVRGFIDTYELKQYNLLPMKGGAMLLPLKAAIRKKIAKGEGDSVHVVLYADDSPLLCRKMFWPVCRTHRSPTSSSSPCRPATRNIISTGLRKQKIRRQKWREFSGPSNGWKKV